MRPRLPDMLWHVEAVMLWLGCAAFAAFPVAAMIITRNPLAGVPAAGCGTLISVWCAFTLDRR